MAPIERDVLIRLRRQEVFAFISDFRNDERWRRFVRNVEADPPGLAWLGTKVHETLLILGLPIRSESEVVEFEQDRWVATRVPSGSRGVATRREVTSEGGDCRCKVSLEPHVEGLPSFAGHLLGVILRRRLTVELILLKHVLEEETVPRTGEKTAKRPG